MTKDIKYTLESIFNGHKGILAADERNSSFKKRFEEWGVEYSDAQRIAYRRMLFSTPDIETTVSGIILSDSTFLNHKVNGILTREFLSSLGIIVGIKVDDGLEQYKDTDFNLTLGLNTLSDKCYEYKRQGAHFTKWRSVIPAVGPTEDFILEMAAEISEYAKIALAHDLVPIIEPEILLKGNHSMDQMGDTLEKVLKYIISAMDRKGVKTGHCILKTSFVVNGLNDSDNNNNADAVAKKTLDVFKKVGLDNQKEFYGIVFLSGGLESSVAIEYLQKIKTLADDKNGEHFFSTPMTFSYGRALQEPAFKIWNGEEENVLSAQVALTQVLQKTVKMYKGGEKGHGAGDGKSLF